jgi:OOP family OmpA-OmpF porin
MPRPPAATVPIVVLVALLTTSCTGGGLDAPAGGSGPSGSSSAGVATDPDDDTGSADFERELRARLELPSLPSFTIPTGLLADTGSRRIAGVLDVPPGLYEGIAVLDARCTDAGAAAADAEGTTIARAQKFEDGTTSITVGGDGTGVYDAPGIHIAVLADGSGNYDDGSTRVAIAADGSGTYDGDGRRITVAASGTGSYEDDEVRIWFDGTGAGGYESDDLRVSRRADGTVFGDEGDEGRIRAVTAVLEDGLPRFPPVPRIEQADPTGTVCGTVIRLDAQVLFGFDRADLEPAGREHFARVAALLVELGSPTAEVDGYSDQVGDAVYNLDLSARRAAAVTEVLVRSGVDARSLSSKGLGESGPLRAETLPDGSDDAAARQLNRRVEIVLLD